jgi:hypothetical protein
MTRRREGISRNLPLFAMNGDLEAVGQEALQHEQDDGAVGLAVRFGLDVIAIRGNPGRTADDP